MAKMIQIHREKAENSNFSCSTLCYMLYATFFFYELYNWLTSNSDKNSDIVIFIKRNTITLSTINCTLDNEVDDDDIIRPLIK